MKKLLNTFLFTLLLTPAMAQEKIILDTDPSFDPDDVGCIAMLHTMASRGECEILAMVNSTNQKESALCISSINQFYNRRAIPVGDYKGYSNKINATELTYDYHLAKDYPRSIEKWEDTEDGVKLYREILESAKDTSITVVIIGTMHNFYGLLKSRSDQLSEKSGKQLVKEKVKLVVSMGGNFLGNEGLDRTNWGGSEELCEYTDWSCMNEERNRMSRYVIENCPAPFMASGWENGNGEYYNAGNGNVISGQGLKQLAADHITRVGYEKHFEYRGGAEDISRHSNDQIALHYAVMGERDNYIAYTKGTITLTASGICKWDDKINRKQGHIQKKKEDELLAAEIEDLMMGAVPALDTSPPSAPKNLRVSQEGDKKVLKWDASEDLDPGSWVVAYAVYSKGNFLQKVHGTRFFDPELDGEYKGYSISAINASGTESDSAVIYE